MSSGISQGLLQGIPFHQKAVIRTFKELRLLFPMVGANGLSDDLMLGFGSVFVGLG